MTGRVTEYIDKSIEIISIEGFNSIRTGKVRSEKT